jgi:uncharacterized protein YceK
MRTIVLVAAVAGLVGCATVQRDAALQDPASQDPAALQKQRDDLHRTMQEERRQRDYEDWMRWWG